MAEISLSAYQDKLDDLLRQRQYNEVVAHARHILQAQPKNLHAYRLLGQALAGMGRWLEAVDALRRRLGAEPSDHLTHATLARAYHQLSQAERALWHAERALDLQPNDESAIALIRDLYREQYQQEIERMQPTTAARAQEQIRKNQMDAALDTLDKALRQAPGRLDLQALRARALWLNGQPMDAAEAAARLLQQLPYAIDANRIMAELWLSERRPSDAQVYLRRIEELDPQLAHQLAGGGNGSAAPMLHELEYSGADESSADLGLLLGAGESQESRVTIDMDGLLADERLFDDMVAGEAIAAVSQLPGSISPAHEFPEPAESPLPALDIAPVANLPDPPSPDDELASMLEALDSGEDSGEWMAEIQQGSPAAAADTFDEEAAADDSAGAPWLSAAMREAADDSDLFGDDDALQQLLSQSSDTEPIDIEDISDWLEDDEDEPLPEIDEELLQSPPSRPWLEDGEPAVFDDSDPNRDNAALIDQWQAELGDDDEDDPYVDWLSEEPPASDSEAQATSDDVADQATDFAAAEGAPGWLNAMVPGLDREHDSGGSDTDDYAKPMGSSMSEFGWVNELVEEETGPMAAIESAQWQDADRPFFRFSQPPVWLRDLQADASPAAAAVSLEDTLDSLELDGLTFDNFYDFDTPTDKLDVINLDEETQRFNVAAMDWDDYFELDSPTEKTIAITLDESLVSFEALGVDDEDFDFQADTERLPAATLDAEIDPFALDDLPADRGSRRNG